MSDTDLRDRLSELTLRDEQRLRRRLQRGADGALATELERAEARVARRRAAVPEVSYPPELPISARREELLGVVRDHPVVIVAGETGSGKSTQIPKLLLELGHGVRGTIAHTQPRRIAARTIAERIAEELGVGLGDVVGYAVRFNDRSSENTLLRLMTDGLLLAEIQRDRLLWRYDAIVVDEAHERSLNVDFLLGYLKSILPRRPDLKVVITSATIDPQRFSRHFDDAPVVEVSGRAYPVEVRHRPVADDGDVVDAIGDAVQELQRAGRGDVLVFLSGEREIRDAAEALTGRLGPGAEVLPLYARLSAAEQQKVFRPGPGAAGRRVVLATNVAETSLTVPGIRSVVDPGTARISRYSARLKVQRLPIERVSQASADQRKGRCGRTSDGICIRLYDEQDFAERPAFTDPEILRTNLASVILQMAALGLGEMQHFGFLDPPDRRQVRDGVALLVELGAFDPAATDPRRRLTPLGRRLARLPVDPRMGRMVLEADKRGCAEEVIVIAAGLTIQDPRERPAAERGKADELHRRFQDEQSDFTAYLNLWRHLGEGRRALTGNQFRKRCKAEYLHYLRVREWQDLVGQLRQSARRVEVTLNQAPGEPRDIAISLLSGLLSHVGLRDASRREYQGARNARFAIFPGSALARRAPDWVMAAELVETSRLWGREVARIDPAWIEPLAGHLVRREHSEPRWDPKRASVVATERVTLYGLPIVTGRRVQYGPIDPAFSRDLFLRRALVEGEWEHRPPDLLSENTRRVAEVEALEEGTRRRGLLAGDEILLAFFEERVPGHVLDGASFERWWRDARRADPEQLHYPRRLLLAPGAEAAQEGRPATWSQGDLVLALSYRFEPGAADDGVTVHVPLTALGALRPIGFDWLVPGLREELVTALIRSLPKHIRRPLVPVPDVARDVVAGVRPRRGAIVEQVAAELRRLRGVQVASGDFDPARLPPHLRMTFSVESADGAVLARGDDLDELRAALRVRLQAELTAAASGLERSGLRDWPGSALERVVTLPGTADAVRGYPALVDEGETAGVRVLETPARQAAAMRAGTLRLLRLTLPGAGRASLDRLSNADRLALARAAGGDLAAILDDVTAAALGELLDAAGGPAWDEAGWARLRGGVAGRLAASVARTLAATIEVLHAAQAVRARLDAQAPAEPLRPARLDVSAQLGRLLHPGFVAATGATRLPDVARSLRAAEVRLGRLPDNVAVDRDRMATLHELEALLPPRLPADSELPWLLEELRVSYFAQALGVRGQVSAKRIRRLIAESGVS